MLEQIREYLLKEIFEEL